MNKDDIKRSTYALASSLALTLTLDQREKARQELREGLARASEVTENVQLVKVLKDAKDRDDA